MQVPDESLQKAPFAWDGRWKYSRLFRPYEARQQLECQLFLLDERAPYTKPLQNGVQESSTQDEEGYVLS